MPEYLLSLSLLIAAVLILRRVFKKRVSPRVIYALWLVVVIRLCLPFSLLEVKLDLPDFFSESVAYDVQTDAVMQDDLTDTAPANVETVIGIGDEYDAALSAPFDNFINEQAAPFVGERTEDTQPYVSDHNASVEVQQTQPVSPELPDATEPISPNEPQGESVCVDWKKVTFSVWAVGSGALALWFLITGGVFYYRLTVNRAFYKKVKKVRVYTTHSSGAPCLAGVVPSIYITPEAAENETQELIIEHEYTHMRHGDHIWAIVRIFALVLHWWNPLVWAAAFISKHDAELACDDAVSAKLGSEKRLEYAHIIIDTIPQKHRHAIGLGSAPMKERIIRLTKKQRNSIVCVILALALTVGAVGCAFSSVTDTDSDDTADTSEDIDGNESACDELYGDYLNGELTMTELMQYGQVRSEASAMINGLLRALVSQSENSGIFDPSMISDVELSDPDAYSFTYTDSQTADAFSVSEGDTHPYRFTLPVDDEQTLVIAFDVNSDGMHPTKLWSEFKAVDIDSNGPFVGYIANAETEWMQVYTETDGLHVANIPYSVMEQFPASDRTSQWFDFGWMNVSVYYGELEDFRWAVVCTGPSAGTGNANVCTSNDGGKTWWVGDMNSTYTGTCIGAYFVSENVGFMSYRYFIDYGPEIARTLDGGKTWERLALTVPAALDGYKMTPLMPSFNGDSGTYPIALRHDDGGKFDGETVQIRTMDGGMTWSWDISALDASGDDISSLIDKNLDILMGGGEFDYEREYVKANQSAFDAIVALGADAVPYLEKLADEYFKYSGGSLEQRRCALAMYIHNQIDPVYDVVSVSPDGKYSLRLYAESFFGMWTGTVGIYYNKATVTDSTSGEIICSSERNYWYPEVSWSPDGRYAALRNGDLRYIKEIQLFDTQSGSAVSLPLLEIADMIEAESKIPVRSRIYSWHLSVDEWGDDTVKILVSSLLGSASDGVFMSANYTYDLTSGKVTALSYNIKGEEPRTIPEIIGEGLDAIMSHYGEFDNEEEYAQAESGAFYEMRWLGESALPYLEDIYSKYSEYESGSKEQIRCFMAMYVAYQIKSSLFDIVSTSPNGKYTLKIEPETFFSLANGSGIKYKKITLYNAETGAKIAEMNETRYAVRVIWSDDGKYAVLESAASQSTSELSLIITANRRSIILPSGEMFDRARAKIGGTLYMQSLHTTFGEWLSDSTVRIDVKMSLMQDGRIIDVTGSYVYDIPRRQIDSYELNGLPDRAAELKATVDSGLDVLVGANTDAGGYIIDTSWKHSDYINTNPDAFDSITALGESAFPYLMELSDKTYSYGFNTADHVRCLLARAAIHVIRPSFYDYTALSPDGKYALSFTITDFFDVSAPEGERSLVYEVSLKNAVDGSVIVTADKEFAYTCNPINLPSAVSWSPYGKYVWVMSGIDDDNQELDMFDLEEGSFYELPDAETIKSFMDGIEAEIPVEA